MPEGSGLRVRRMRHLLRLHAPSDLPDAAVKPLNGRSPIEPMALPAARRRDEPADSLVQPSKDQFDEVIQAEFNPRRAGSCRA